MKKQKDLLAPAPTAQQFYALNSAYEYFNKVLFREELPGCILNFSRMSGAHGFMAPERWRRVGDTSYSTHEISLTPATLYRDPILVFSTLVHEMAHLWQWEFGNPSRSGYHNKEWAEKMIEIGLMPSHTGQPGGKVTGQAMTHYIIPEGKYEKSFNQMPGTFTLPFTSLDAELLKLALTGMNGGQGSDDDEGNSSPSQLVSSKLQRLRPKSQNKIKYSCSSCRTNVWGKPALKLKCLTCDNEFSEVG